MQLYYPTRVARTFAVTALRGEIVRIGLDWTHLGTVSSSSWLNEGRITTISGASRSANVAQIYVTMTGLGREVVQNTVVLASGEAFRQQFEIRILPAQESETPNPNCPVLLLPVNDAVGSLLTSQPVSWSSTPFALSYNVYLDGELIANTADLAHTFTDLAPNTEYTWTVVPVGENGELASCNERTFTTAQLDCPGLTVPTDGSAVGAETSTTLLWSAVENAATYNVYVWENGDPQPGTPTTTTALLTYEATGLLSGTTYRWTVDAVSADGYVSPGCESSTFTTNAADAIIEWQSAAFTGDILGAEVTLTAIRSGNTTTTASADYDFTEGTALIGPDFIATPGTVTFAPGEVTKDVVVPLVRDYDAEVLADSIADLWSYTKYDETSGVNFADHSGNGRTQSMVSATSSILYNQNSINLAAVRGIRQPQSTGSCIYQHVWDTNGGVIPAMQDCSFHGWVKFDTGLDNNVRSIIGIGGSSGSAQKTKLYFYRNPGTNTLNAAWDITSVITHPRVTFNFATTLPALGTPVWLSLVQNCTSRTITVQINDGAPETISWLAANDPWQNTNPPYQTYICLAGVRVSGQQAKPIGGAFSHFEFRLDTTVRERWTRWNLNASLNFTATLSNPSVDTQIGAVDETEMTISA